MPTVGWTEYFGKTVWVTSGVATQDETTSGALQQLSRVQSLNWDIAYPLQDQVYLDGGVDSYNPVAPEVNVTVDFLHTQASNERYLGLGKWDSSGNWVLGLDDERNMYVSFEDEQGHDSIGAPRIAPRTVLGLAQGVLTSYQLSAAVGGLIQSRATLNYLTASIYSGASGEATAAINPHNGNALTGRFVIPTPSAQYVSSTGVTLESTVALGAREMTMMFPANSPFGIVFTGQQACFLQSMQLGVSINRTAVKPLGYAYPPERPAMWPIQVDLNTEAIVGKYQVDRLRRLQCTVTGQAIFVAIKQPCSATTVFGFYFTDMQMVGQSFGATIGGADTVTTNWRGFLRSPSDTFLSPFWSTIIRLDTSGEWGTSW